jgi:hypothetical protein
VVLTLGAKRRPEKKVSRRIGFNPLSGAVDFPHGVSLEQRSPVSR